MTDAIEEVVTLDDFTGPTDDDGGGGYEQFVSDQTPEHDPFVDYPAETRAVEEPVALFGIPMQVAATLAHNLDVRRQKIWSCWGHGVAVGWISDAAHQARCTDHNKDAGGVVHAIDPMVTGARAKTVVAQCLASRDDLQYVIHNRVIWSRSSDWAARVYTGSNPHTDHVHISGKHGNSRQNSATCTGYDIAAEKVTPVFDICPTPKPPVPKPPVKPTPPKPPAHAPGTRELKLTKNRMSGADVLFVQKFIGKKHAGVPDGKYGPTTAAGVRWYQDLREIPVDGIVGKGTFKQMGVKWHG